MCTVLDQRAHSGMARLSWPTLRLTTPRLVLGSAVLGVLVSVVWSSSLVDRTIGENLASVVLGYGAAAEPITNTLMGAIFAFVSGLTLWLAASPDRLARFSATALIMSGAFLITYWCVRVPSFFGIGWWLTVPWD